MRACRLLPVRATARAARPCQELRRRPRPAGRCRSPPRPHLRRGGCAAAARGGAGGPRCSRPPWPPPHVWPPHADALLAFHGFPDEFGHFRLFRLGLAPEDEGDPPAPRPTVLDGLVTTLLSQNTTDAIAHRAFASLKAAFPSWDQVVDEVEMGIEDSIRCEGLAATKAARVRAMLRGVREKRGAICLEYLRELSMDEVKRELSQFKGIGPKTNWG